MEDEVASHHLVHNVSAIVEFFQSSSGPIPVVRALRTAETFLMRNCDKKDDGGPEDDSLVKQEVHGRDEMSVLTQQE